MLRAKTEIKNLQKLFDLSLKDWKIEYETKSDDKAKVFKNPKLKIATIYSYNGKRPNDFILHEILHIIIADLLHDYNIEKEEQIIQSICGLVYNEE